MSTASPARATSRSVRCMVFSLCACGLRTRAAESRRQPGCGADLAELPGDLAPGLAGVLADVDLAEETPRHDPTGVGGMRREAPHGGVGPDGQGEAPPGLPAVARAEHAARLSGRGLAAPGEQDARIVGLHR